MEFLNNGRERNPFECQIVERFGQDYAIYVKCGNYAFAHEVNALVMVLDGCQNIACNQEMDDDNSVIWHLW